MKNIVVLGSTGSIGEQTLDIVREFPETLRVVGVAAHRSVNRLIEQGQLLPEAELVIVDETLDVSEEISQGENAMIEMACSPEVDLVVAAIVGGGGLRVTLEALKAGKMVALANKEALVMGGPVIKQQLGRSGTLVPIDSEHSAIWQCLQGEAAAGIEKVVLTASGGAFRDYSVDQLAGVTPSQALSHPTWTMGPKVTVDSATLMNKGLEVLEATLLFDLPIDKVDVLMHRESIIHSLVYFTDSSVKAQLGVPDMRLPIQYALMHPTRLSNDLERLELAELGALHFGPVPPHRYPCLELALEAGTRGGTAPTVLCAADETAVGAFLSGELPFPAISDVVGAVLTQHDSRSEPSFDDVIAVDEWARQAALRAAAKFATVSYST